MYLFFVFWTLVQSFIFPPAHAASRIWNNLVMPPAQLSYYGLPITAGRVEDPTFQWHSMAIEDFVFLQPKQIRKIVVFGVLIGNPNILGMDWYVYDGQSQYPTWAIAGENDAHFQTDVIGSYGPDLMVRVTITLGTPLNLPIGLYYLGVRGHYSVDMCPGQDCKFGIFAQPSGIIGYTDAFFTQSADSNGLLVGGVTPLNQYLGQMPAEWAFGLIGP